MANWCEGELKVRGEYENIKRFLKSELRQYELISEGDEFSKEKELPIDFIEEDGYLEINTKRENEFYLNDSKTALLEANIEIEIKPKGKIITEVLGTLSWVWNLDTELLINFSKTYNLDFKIYAYERGMQFNVDFEVHKGDIIKNERIEFTDYEWECTNPGIGG